MNKKNLNVEINENSIRKAKAKASILGLQLNEFIERIIDIQTKNIMTLEELE